MRRHGFDWLRVSVVFLLLPFHTARVFDAWEPNYVKDAVNGFSTWFVAALGYWFMPLLFFIAGYGAYCALGRRSVKEFLHERVRRLLVPLLFGVIVIVPPQGYLALVQQYGFTGSYFDYLGSYFTNFADLTGYTGGFTPGHLWFLLYLFVISAALVAPVRSLVARPEKLRGLARPWVMLLGFVPLTVMEALPAIAGKNVAYFALLYMFGAIFANSDAFSKTVRKLRFWLLGGALCTGALMLMVAAHDGWPSGYNAAGIGFACLRNLATWLMILALAGLADAYWNRDSRVLRYLNGVSYPVYIVHQTLLLVLAYFVVIMDISPAIKFLAITLGGCALSLGFAELCRRFGVMRFLLGIK